MVVTLLHPPRASMREAIEQAHAALHPTRCQGWLTATGNRPVTPYDLDRGFHPLIVAPSARPRPRDGCELHPVEP